MDPYVVIKIELKSPAFQEDASAETARILRELANRIDGQPHFSAGHDQALLDNNKVEVGYLTVTTSPTLFRK